MTDFVEQCRLEWRRLRVPDELAEEMATDLAADVAEAKAEGVSAEAFLGSDPRSFAASWAAERGVIPASPSPQTARRRRPLALVAFTTVAAIVLVFAALGLLTGQPRAALATTVSGTSGRHLPSPASSPFGPLSATHHVLVLGNLAAPIEWILLVFAFVALCFAVWLWSLWTRSRPPGVQG